MAQLKDLLVTGASRLIGDVYTSQIQISKLNALTGASATTYGSGTSGQVLMSNGTNTYWGTPAAGVTESTVSGWGFTKNTGTVTSITINTTSPVSGGSSTATTTTGTYTISLANGYGDTKNPYASKTKNYILAAPSTANGAPTFRALVAADLPTVPVSKGGTGMTTATNKNAVVIGNSSTVTNAMQTVRTASGAFYATAQDAKPAFGTLPVAQGGTGVTSVANIKAGKDGNGNTISTTYVKKSYGETLPSTGAEGDIFFQISNESTTSVAADTIKTTAATANANYYLIGATAAGNLAPYIATANAAGTNNTLGVYFNGATGVLSGAAWNDYAEYRIKKNVEGIPYGHVVIENGDDSVSLSTKRLQPCGQIISDTYGFTLGKEENALPIALCGRVLAYPYEDRKSFFVGDAVCTGPDGTVSKMTREEIKEYPDRIIGYVASIPNYQLWGDKNIEVKGRIWIKVK